MDRLRPALSDVLEQCYREPVEIDLTKWSKYGIPCLEASDASTDDIQFFRNIVKF